MRSNERAAVHRRRVVAVGIAVAGVVAAAMWVLVQDDSSGVVAGDGSGVVAAVEDALRAPGTEIVPGVTVQDGSALVATAFPGVNDGPRGVETVGWQAVLIVAGDPVQVWDRYVAELGLDERAMARGACVAVALPVVADGSTPRSRLLTDPALPGENHLSCHAYVGEVSMAMGVGLQQCARTDAVACPPRSVAHLYVRDYGDPAYANPQGQFGADELRWLGTHDETGPVLAPLSKGPIVAPRVDLTGRSYLPEPGERLDDEIDYFLNHATVAFVPDGARSLVAPGMPIECTSGLVAVLDVPGDPTTAIKRFEDRTNLLRMRTADGGPGGAAAGRVIAAGDFDLSVAAVDLGGGSSAVLLTECGD